MMVTEHLQDDRAGRINRHPQVAGSGSRPKERAKVAGLLHREYLLVLCEEPNQQVVVGEYEYKNDSRIGTRTRAIAASFSEFESQFEPTHDQCMIEEMGKSGDRKSLDEFLQSGRNIDDVGGNGLSIVCEAAKNNNIALVLACRLKNQTPNLSRKYRKTRRFQEQNRRAHVPQPTQKSKAQKSRVSDFSRCKKEEPFRRTPVLSLRRPRRVENAQRVCPHRTDNLLARDAVQSLVSPDDVVRIFTPGIVVRHGICLSALQ